MADIEAELRKELLEAFSGADYPVNNQMDLVPALPNGPSTTFEAGGKSFTAMELATKLSSRAEFPYDEAETLVDDVIEGLRDEGDL